jgi:hypothetical protein
MEHFIKYLYVQEFQVNTDQTTLTCLPSFMNLWGQRARWVHRLQEYNFISEHRQLSNTRTLTLFPGDHASKSAFIANRFNNLQTAQGRV